MIARPAVAAALAVLLLAVAVPARAAGPEVGIADDRVLFAGGPAAERAVAEWRRLGVDVVRVFALWSRHAPAVRPPGFDAADPAAPGYRWWPLDAAVDRVRAAGMRVMLTVTGPGPRWSSRGASRRRPAHRPRPAAFAEFATAVARRFGARVERYIVWNEPNIAAWLHPQARCRRGRCTPVAPHLYRDLVRAAYPALRAADPGAEVIAGALSPRGGDLRRADATHRPLAFLRALGCRTRTFERSRARDCRGFRPIQADGFAIHPYSGREAPEHRHPHRDDVSLAELGDLQAALDRLQRRGALRSTGGRLGIYVDEYGYQTNPPDRIGGVSARRQDAWLQRAAYLAWRNPRVRLLTQYLWRDEPRSADGSFGGWQSGLRYLSGRRKPALAHFAAPFVADVARDRLWGQVRPGGRHRVTVERRARGGSRWRPFAAARTDARGYWSLRRRLAPGRRYRASVSASSAQRRGPSALANATARSMLP